jgi:hypothetical protein
LNWITELIDTSSNAYVVRQAVMKLANNEDLPERIVERIRSMKEVVLAKHKNDVNYPIRAAMGTILKLNVEDDAN